MFTYEFLKNVTKITGIASQTTVLVYLVWLILVPQALNNELKLPLIACPNYFRYEPNGRGYIGKISLNDVPFSKLDLEVTFSQKEALGKNFTGRISFEHDLITVQKDFEAGNPIIFNVEFPVATEIPMLNRIKMNGEDICSASTNHEHTAVYSFRRSFTPAKDSQRIPKNETLPATDGTDESSVKTTDYMLCGLTSFNKGYVFVGVHNVTWGWFPWTTKIYRRNSISHGLSLSASGVLLSSKSIITVMSPFNDKDTVEGIVVHLGISGLSDFVDSYPLTRRVRSLLRHPDYVPNRYSDADIALLQLDRPVIFNRYILPICLWDEPDAIDKIVGEKGYVTYAPWSGIDRVISVTTISQWQCRQFNKDYINVPSRTLCIDYEYLVGPNTIGHDGSALIFIRNGLWTLRGIYSACTLTNGGCFATEYFVYNDVAKFRTWIRDNIII